MNINLKEMNASAFNYVKSNLSQFQEICEPLAGIGINYFSYIRIFNNGSYLAIDNDLEYRKAYLETIKNQGHLYTYKLFPTACLNEFKYHLVNNLGSFDRENDAIIALLNDFKKRNCLTIYRLIDENTYESYNFSISYDDSYASTFFLNHIHILKRFIVYFNDKAQHIINSEDKSKLAHLEQTFNFSNFPADTLLTEKVKKFLIQTKLQDRLMNGMEGQVKLAKREFECLHYLSLGNSTKEIGHILNLSPRTIEFYLRNIKSKTGYRSRNILLAQFAKSF